MKRSPQSKKEIHYLLLSFIIVSILIILANLVSLYQIEKMHNTTTNIYEHPLKVSNAALNVKLGVYKIHRDMKDVVLSSSKPELEKKVTDVFEHEKRTYKNLKIIENQILGQRGLELHNQTKELFRNWKPIREEVISLMGEKKRDEAVAITKGKGAKHVVELEKASEELYQYANNKAKKFKEESETLYKDLKFINIEVFTIILILVVGLIFFSIKRVSRYIYANEYLSRISSVMSDLDKLIVREKNAYELIKKSCKILVTDNIYVNAWIVLFDEKKNVKYFVSAVETEYSKEFFQKLKTIWFPECLKNLSTNSHIYNTYHNNEENCKECPLLNDHENNIAFNIKLIYEEKFYGYLTLSIDEKILHNKREVKLIKRIANDISYALHNINLEEQFIETNKRYRELFKRNKAVELVINSDSGKIIDCNDKALEYYGYDYQQLTSMFISEINILTKEEVAFEMNQAKLENRSKFNFKHKLANGEIRDVEVYSGPISINKENLLYSIVFDVTELRELEKSNEVIQERLALVLDGSRDGIWDWNIVTDEVYFSPRCKEILGYSDEEFENSLDAWKDNVYRDDLEQAVLDIKKSIEGKTGDYKSFFRMQHKNGSWVWIEARGQTIFDDNGQAIRMLGSHTDITKEKEKEHEIVHLKELYNNIIDSVDNLIFVKDIESRYITCNKAYEKFLGISKDEIIGKSDEVFYNEELSNWFRAHDKKIIESKETIANFEWVNDIDGKMYYFLTTKSPLFDSDGKVMGIVGNSVDFAERQHLYEQLKDSQSIAKLGTWEQTFDDELLEWSDEVFNIFEFDIQETMTYEMFIERVHPDDREMIASTFAKSVKERTKYYLEHRLLFSDGRIKYVQERAEHFFTDNKHIRTLGTVQDITDEKLKDIELKKREEQLKNIVSNLPGMAYRCSDDDRWTMKFLSENCKELLGYEVEDILENRRISYNEIIHPNDREIVKAAIHNELAVNERFSIDYRVITSDGDEKWVWEQGVLVSKEGEEPYLEGIILDNDERKKAEFKLIQNENRFRMLFENSEISIWNEDFTEVIKSLEKLRKSGIHDIRKHLDNNFEETMKLVQKVKVTDVNYATLKLFKADSKEQFFSGIDTTFGPGAIEVFKEVIYAVWEKKKMFSQEAFYKTFDDEIIHGIVTFQIPNDIDSFSSISVNIIDITNLKKIEKELIESKIRYETAEKIGKVGSWEYDVAKEEFWASDESKAIYGFPLESTSFTTQKVENCIPERERVHQALIDLIEKGAEYNLEFEIEPFDGSKTKIISSVAELVYDESGKPEKVTGFIQDITELKSKDDMILRQSRHAAMGEMIGMIAHQWRQPISVISMDANNMLADIALEEFNQALSERYAQDILHQTDHLSKTIDDFRKFFKPDKEKSKIDIQKIVEETYSIVKDSLKNHDIEFKTSFNTSLKTYGFPRELMQVFVNIINNSKDAIVSKGVENATIEVKTYETKEYIHIDFYDNGGGIDADIINKIFDPYFTTKDEKSGTGLGLYMSKMIIEDHLDGIIEVENIENGVCFKVKLLIFESTV